MSEASPEVVGFWKRYRRERAFDRRAARTPAPRTRPKPAHVAAVARVLTPLISNRTLRVKVAHALLTSSDHLVHEAMEDLLIREGYIP